MRIVSVVMTLSLALTSLSALAAPPSDETVKKIVAQGVSADAMARLVKFMYENEGRSFIQDTYSCADQVDPESVKPCEEKKRSNSNQTVTLQSPTLVVIVDYTLPSTERRFFYINLETAKVEKYFTAHGVGSGDNYAYKFSNTKDSRQTSLGIYITGETYIGKYGETLRLYGLQKSNDQAYNRDIVFHGAWYVGEDFIKKINPKTKQPFGRIGLSWGCPAVSPYIGEKLIPILKNGNLFMHYHKDLIDRAQSGREVRGDVPFEAPVPRMPPKRPSAPTVIEEAPTTAPTAPIVPPTTPVEPTYN